MSEFPSSIYDPRTKSNKSGVIYDPTESTKLFSEDISKLDDEVVAIESILGGDVSGSYASLLARLSIIDSLISSKLSIEPRVLTITSSSSPSIDSDSYDCVDITALEEDITSMTTNLTGSPSNFQRLTIRFVDDGTSRAISWGDSFKNGAYDLPVETIVGSSLIVQLIFDSDDSKFSCEGTKFEGGSSDPKLYYFLVPRLVEGGTSFLDKWNSRFVARLQDNNYSNVYFDTLSIPSGYAIESLKFLFQPSKITTSSDRLYYNCSCNPIKDGEADTSTSLSLGWEQVAPHAYKNRPLTEVELPDTFYSSIGAGDIVGFNFVRDATNASDTINDEVFIYGIRVVLAPV